MKFARADSFSPDFSLFAATTARVTCDVWRVAACEKVKKDRTEEERERLRKVIEEER